MPGLSNLAGYGRSALGWWGARSMTARGAMIGAAVGGLYGAFSNNTSVLGGMAKGATLGAGAGWAYPSAALGINAARLGKASGMGWGGAFKMGGKLAAQHARLHASSSAVYIGNTAMRAYNGFSGFAGTTWGKMKAFGQGVRQGFTGR